MDILNRAYALSDAHGGFNNLDAVGGWEVFSPTASCGTGAIPGEASSSESDDSDTETVVI